MFSHVLPDILGELKKIAKSLDGGVLKPGIASYEAAGEIDGVPALASLHGELKNGIL